MDYAIRIDRVSKRFRLGAELDLRTFRDVIAGTEKREREDRTLWALRDVSFDVRRGEAIGVIGLNGAGKSTLLKILSRITEPTSGRIEMRGLVSSLLEVGTGFHPELTGRENIQLNGAILGMTRREIRSRFDEIVAFAEVERFVDTAVKFYSSGMYMRLAFAVAAHLDPEILIVDEVLAVGDAAFQAKCLRKMNDVTTLGRTILFVSHNMPAVKALCQKAVWLDQGKVVEIGDSASVVGHYLHAISRAGREEVQQQIERQPADPLFQLHSLRLMQFDDETTNVHSGDAICVEAGFELFEPTRDLQLSFQLIDLEGTLIMESILFGECDVRPLLEAGRHVARVTIPADLLAPRPFELRLFANLTGVRSCLVEPIRLMFDVQQSGLVNRALPGYQTQARISPRLQWSVDRVYNSPAERT